MAQPESQNPSTEIMLMDKATTSSTTIPVPESPTFIKDDFNSRNDLTQRQLLSQRQISNTLGDLPSNQIETALETNASNEEVKRRFHTGQKFSTLRFRKAVMSQARDNISQAELLSALARNPELNQHTPESEQLRLETLRDMHYSLSMKRSVRRQLSQVPTRKPSIQHSYCSHLQFRLKKAFVKIKSKLHDKLHSIDLWTPHIQKIEGQFGCFMGYYFRFLQQMVLLNVLLFIISCCFILIPQLSWKFSTIYNLSNNTSVQINKNSSYFWTEPLNYANDSVPNNYTEVKFSWLDIITGSRYLTSTEMYYGAYTNSTIEVFQGLPYNVPVAYVCATTTQLLLSLFLLAVWVADAYKKYLAANPSYGAHGFCNLVFCSWDFTIISKETSLLTRIGILNNIQVKLERLRTKKRVITCSEKCTKYTKQFVNHLISFSTIFFCGFITWYLLQRNTLKTDLPVFAELMLPLVVTSIFIVLPAIFSIMVTWEGYDAKGTEVYITLIRMMLLLMTVLGALCHFWFEVTPNYSHTGIQVCWETQLGEEIYRLLFVDFIISSILYFIVSYVRNSYPFSKFFEKEEFNVAWNTWNLIYNQILCWLGSLYCPVISGLVLIKLILTFYIKKLHVETNCKPLVKSWGASQAKTVFHSVAFLGLVATLIPVGYSIIGIKPSDTCGPFQGKVTIYDVVFDLLEHFHIKREWFGSVMYFVTRPGCVAGLIVLLCAIAFQAKSNAQANKDMVEKLQEQVILEGTDKSFLLQMVDRATRLQLKHNWGSQGNIKSR